MSRFKLVSLIALILVAGMATAKPVNGSMGVYLDAQGNVVGTWIVSCDGQFNASGTRTSKMVSNGHLWCNLP